MLSAHSDPRLLGQIQKLCKGDSYSCYHVSVILNCPGKVIKFPVKSKSKLSSEKQITMRRENTSMHADLIIFIAATFSGDPAGWGAAG